MALSDACRYIGHGVVVIERDNHRVPSKPYTSASALCLLAFLLVKAVLLRGGWRHRNLVRMSGGESGRLVRRLPA